MSSPDALAALRSAASSKFFVAPVDSADALAPSLLLATHLRLSPTLVLPKSTPTRLRRPAASASANTAAAAPSDPHAEPDAFFSLAAVYLAWSLRDASSAEYMKHARESGLAVGFVGLTERKGVVEWLSGKLAHLDSVVPPTGGEGTTTPPGTPPPDAFFSKHARSTLRTAAHASHGRTPSSAAGYAHHHAAGAAGSTASPAKRRYVADAHDLEIVKKIRQGEVELRDRTTVLRGIKANNFAAIRNAYTAKLKAIKDAKKPGKAPAAVPAVPDPKLLARRQKNYYPIIMISSSPTALITMHNVKRFLEDALFEPSSDARARAAAEGNTRPEDLIPVYRRRTTIDPSGRETTTSQRYYVVDSVDALNKFGADAWDRVVCVMTTGQAWQFRPYKWKEPLSLFHHVKGVYVSWTNDPPNPKIKDWNVTEIKIDPNRRHVDKSTVAHFWKMLDTWTTQNKPSLMMA